MASNFVEADANLAEFRSFLSEVVKVTTDLRPYFGVLAKRHRKKQREIFRLKGPGKYTDFKKDPKLGYSPYKRWKLRNLTFAYPLLVRTGKLAQANLYQGAAGSIFRTTKLNFQIGVDAEIIGQLNRENKSNYPYPLAHQEGRGNNPERRFIFLDDVEAKAWGDIIQKGLQKQYQSKGWTR